MLKTVRIVGVGQTKVGRLGVSASALGLSALEVALKDAGMKKSDLQGLIAVPSLAAPQFMQGHSLATTAGLLPSRHFTVRTVDTGGAGPVSAVATAVNMIRSEWADTVAVVASDAVLSLESEEFMRRANNSVAGSGLPSPAIPHGYDMVAQWELRRSGGGLRREHYAMTSAIMSYYASRHPGAMCRKPHTVEDILASPKIAAVTNLLECARRADGAGAVILSSQSHYKRSGFGKGMDQSPVVVGFGEASGPLYPPTSGVTDDMFSCERAVKTAMNHAQVGVRDIDYFGIYDCFPVCFVRALEAVGVVKSPAEAGGFIEAAYTKLRTTGALVPTDFPFNTHGGLMAYGAPWEAPAMFSLIEAVRQLQGKADIRQVTPKPRRSLVYANGGIFSSSAVVILGDGIYD